MFYIILYSHSFSKAQARLFGKPVVLLHNHHTPAALRILYSLCRNKIIPHVVYTVTYTVLTHDRVTRRAG